MAEALLAKEHIDRLLIAAIAAPSMHNTQPWRFELHGHVIDVLLDSSRALPAGDPSGRALRIAAGAATFNLRCAAASMGYDSWLGLAPCPDEPNLVARIVLEPSSAPEQELRALAAQITHRHTSRVPVHDFPLSQDVRIALTQAAFQENVELTWLPETETARILGRTRTSAPFEQHPAIAVLSTDRDEPADQLTAGLALERVLLTATREGVTASFLNQPLEYDDLRRAVQRTTGKPGFAHMVIRFGYGRTTATTPRRPVADFVRPDPLEQSWPRR
jgi:hypothetical protein